MPPYSITWEAEKAGEGLKVQRTREGRKGDLCRTGGKWSEQMLTGQPLRVVGDLVRGWSDGMVGMTHQHWSG